MSEMQYYQYAFAQPDCHVQAIGPGIDPHFDVELIGDGLIAAVASRIGKDCFDFGVLRRRTPEEMHKLRTIATRHNEIVCRAAESSTVFPLQLGTMFRSRHSLQTTLQRCGPRVAEFMRRLDDRQEWNVKLYLKTMRLDRMATHVGPPPPHFASVLIGGSGAAVAEKTDADRSRELRVAVRRTIRTVERYLRGVAEHCCRTHGLPSAMSGRRDKIVFSAAFLLPGSAREDWLETVQQLCQDVRQTGLQLEMTGPWPPYHFCPSLDLSTKDAILPVATV
jgi:hypothetical protein